MNDLDWLQLWIYLVFGAQLIVAFSLWALATIVSRLVTVLKETPDAAHIVRTLAEHMRSIVDDKDRRSQRMRL